MVDYIVKAAMTTACTIYYFGLLAIAGVGYALKATGEFIGSVGEKLMKLDPMR